MRKLLVLALLGLASLLTVSMTGTASADDTTPWSASYQTAHASGTWQEVSLPVFDMYLEVDGTLTNTGSGCYHVQITGVDVYGTEWASGSSGGRCGAGTAPVTLYASLWVDGPILYRYVNLQVCAGSGDETSDCGPATTILSFS
jgi:hypothetical protein